jgi:hypothetical protein
VVSASAIEVRRLMLELGVLAILLLVIVLGLPFAAGYLVGRSAQQRSRTAGH